MSYFTPGTFAFLRDLADNNSRDWFTANSERFEEQVREPALDFITDFTGALSSLSPHFVADARKSGGSLFRIQRDTRFSKDKTPYKGNIGIQFRHERAKDVHAPGFYLNVEPRNCFMGIGLWRPETAAANTIRGAIDNRAAVWTDIMTTAAFADTFEMAGDSLKRPPKGFDADHPLIDDLKRKDFIATTTLTQKQVTDAAFLDDFAALCRTGSPFMAFLCQALDISY